MKGIITKIFKLDEPLGRSGFHGLLFIVFIIIKASFYIAEKNNYIIESSIYPYMFFVMITPFAVRRLKDINANEFLAGLFILPSIFQMIFYFIIPLNITTIFDSYERYMAIFVIFYPAAVLILFFYLLLVKGSKATEQKPRFIRKHTLIIFIIFLIYTVTVFSFYQHQVYHAEKKAVLIVEALDKFKSEEGYYPEKIEEIVPRFLNEMPKSEGYFITTSYVYRCCEKYQKESKFCIKFYTLLGTAPEYCSDNREWINSGW